MVDPFLVLLGSVYTMTNKSSTIINVDLKDDYSIVKTLIDILDIRLSDFVRIAVQNHIIAVKRDPEYPKLVEGWKVSRQLLEKEVTKL